MNAQLILTDARGRMQRVALADVEILIGRNHDCDLVLASNRVSRRHAVIRPAEGRHLFVDLQSAYGSSVNGVPVAAPVLLTPGDRIELANSVELVYQEASRRAFRTPALLGAAAVAAAALVFGAISLWPDDEPDAVMLEAVALADRGIDAARAGDQIAARDHLRAAAGILYKNGRLDEVPRGDLQRAAMMRLQGHVDVTFDLWSFYDNVLRTPYVPPATTTAQRRCRLDQVHSRELEACLKLWIAHVMLELHQEPESVPRSFHRKVGERLRVEHGFLSRSFGRGKKLVPMLKRELEAAKMPPLLHYVALIESGYRNAATSTAAAAGLWQFMPATGRQYDLRVNDRIDERRDPEKSTRAAARYLRDLAFEFGGDALLLGLAGYNRGENGVRRALKQLDDPFNDRSYWRLVERDLLPRETQDYVPRFIAAAVAGEGGLPDIDQLERAGY